MQLQQLLSKYQGRVVATDSLAAYPRWALDFFQDKRYVADPYLSITLQLDITAAHAKYRQKYAIAPGASLTAYLIWKLLGVLRHHDPFNYRLIGDQWYQFDNLPLFFPVAVGGQQRFNEMFLEDIVDADWQNFCRRYREGIDKRLQSGSVHQPIDNDIWEIAIFIGNLPYLQFTSLNIHRGVRSAGRPIFYFGQRYHSENKYLVPLYTALDHSNTDPYVLHLLLEDYQQQLLQ